MERSNKLKEKIVAIKIAQCFGLDQLQNNATANAMIEAVKSISDFINPYSGIERPFLSAALIHIGEEMQKNMDEVEKEVTEEIIRVYRESGTAEEERCNPCKE